VFVAGTATLRTNEMNFYVRDEWRATTKLTLNIGVHYEVNTPFVEKKDQWVNFDPASGKQLLAGRDGVSRSGNIDTDLSAFAPRISIAYQATKKTVLRGGYGLFFFPQGNAGTNIRQFRQPPYDFVVNLPFSGNDIPSTSAAQGFPLTTTVPDLTKGPAFYALRGVTPNFRNGQMQQFNFSVQRELGKELVATVGFVGSAGAKLYWARNINQPDPGPGDAEDVGDLLGVHRLLADIEKRLDLGDGAVDAPLAAEIAPLQDESPERRRQAVELCCYFCHDRNIGQKRPEVKGIPAAAAGQAVAASRARAPMAAARPVAKQACSR
jgi:hypothetical protein